MNRQPGVGIQTMKHPPSSQSAGTGDVRFSDLGDCEPLPAPKPAPGKGGQPVAAGKPRSLEVLPASSSILHWTEQILSCLSSDSLFGWLMSFGRLC